MITYSDADREDAWHPLLVEREEKNILVIWSIARRQGLCQERSIQISLRPAKLVHPVIASCARSRTVDIEPIGRKAARIYVGKKYPAAESTRRRKEHYDNELATHHEIDASSLTAADRIDRRSIADLLQ